jgi:hypothetical protein
MYNMGWWTRMQMKAVSVWCYHMLNSVWAVQDGPGDQNKMNQMSEWLLSLCIVRNLLLCSERDLYHHAQCVACIIMLSAWPVLLCSVRDLYHTQCVTSIITLSVWPLSLCLLLELYRYAQYVTSIIMLIAWPISLCSISDPYHYAPLSDLYHFTHWVTSIIMLSTVSGIS